METKNREKILAIAVGVAVACWLGEFVVVKPVVTAWHNKSDQIADLQHRLAAGKQLLSRGSEVMDRWRAMQTNSLPGSPALAESKVLTSFDQWVSDSGVTQGSFRPQYKETDDNYSTMECRADVTGDMEQIFTFLYDLEKDPAGIKLDSVELTSRDDTGRQLALVIEMSGLMLPQADTQP